MQEEIKQEKRWRATIKLTADVVFKGGRVQFLDREYERFVAGELRKAEGSPGYIIIQSGERTRSLKANAFFHGPLIDAFVRLTGETDRAYWKSYLKELFLFRVTETGKTYVPSTADLSSGDFARFLTNCKDHLADQGGHLTELEGREYLDAVGSRDKNAKDSENKD